MAWVAVDENGDEWYYKLEPYRILDAFWCSGKEMPLEPGSIKKLIGRTITWDDEPVELTENLPIDKR